MPTSPEYDICTISPSLGSTEFLCLKLLGFQNFTFATNVSTNDLLTCSAISFPFSANSLTDFICELFAQKFLSHHFIPVLGIIPSMGAKSISVPGSKKGVLLNSAATTSNMCIISNTFVELCFDVNPLINLFIASVELSLTFRNYVYAKFWNTTMLPESPKRFLCWMFARRSE